MLRMWESTVLALRTSSSDIVWFVFPPATRESTSRSRLLSRSSGRDAPERLPTRNPSQRLMPRLSVLSLYLEDSVSFVDAVGAADTTLRTVTSFAAVSVPDNGALLMAEEQATCTATLTSTGPQSVYATFVGNGLDYAFSQGEVTLDVTELGPTTTAVTASPAVPQVGQAVTYTATVSDLYGSDPAPTRTVSFTGGSAQRDDVNLSSTPGGAHGDLLGLVVHLDGAPVGHRHLRRGRRHPWRRRVPSRSLWLRARRRSASLLPPVALPAAPQLSPLPGGIGQRGGVLARPVLGGGGLRAVR